MKLWEGERTTETRAVGCASIHSLEMMLFVSFQPKLWFSIFGSKKKFHAKILACGFPPSCLGFTVFLILFFSPQKAYFFPVPKSQTKHSITIIGIQSYFSDVSFWKVGLFFLVEFKFFSRKNNGKTLFWIGKSKYFIEETGPVCFSFHDIYFMY